MNISLYERNDKFDGAFSSFSFQFLSQTLRMCARGCECVCMELENCFHSQMANKNLVLFQFHLFRWDRSSFVFEKCACSNTNLDFKIQKGRRNDKKNCLAWNYI